MDNEKKGPIFLSGFIFKRPREGAPIWVKGQMSIKVDEAIAFLQKHRKEDGWLNADLKQSKDGQKLYLQLNEYRKEDNKPSNEDV